MPSQVNRAGNAIAIDGAGDIPTTILDAQGIGSVIVIHGVYLTAGDDTNPYIVEIQATDNTTLIPEVSISSPGGEVKDPLVLPYCTPGWATAPANTGIKLTSNGPTKGVILFSVIPGKSS
jgi:hypothetical protein